MSPGQDPTPEIAHFLGRNPEENRVMCLVHGGKSIPWYVTFRGPCGTGETVVPFSVKHASPLEAVGRSEAMCTQCPPSATHKKNIKNCS